VTLLFPLLSHLPYGVYGLRDSIVIMMKSDLEVWADLYVFSNPEYKKNIFFVVSVCMALCMYAYMHVCVRFLISYNS
jgi:hypothetical protein